MNILITGASKGIGAQLALELARENHHLVLLSRNSEKLEELVTECNEAAGNEVAKAMVCDLLKMGEDHAAFKRELEHYIKDLDVLVNNAGSLFRKPFIETALWESKEMFDVNFFAPAMLISVVLPMLKRSKSASIVNVTSMAAVQGASKFSGLSMYSASKGALATLTESLAEEFKDMNIRVNALAFGAVQTEMLAEAFPGYEAAITPEEMGKFFKWFVLEGSKYFNGKMLPVTISTP